MTVNFDLHSTKDNFKKYAHVKSKLIVDTCSDLKPQVSIMIPTFKRPHLIKESIDSAVGQKTDVTFEVVIVDNDADDEFSEELKKLISSYEMSNIRYFTNEENIGMFGNWNRCIELARSEYLTILNDDDLLSVLWACETYPYASGRPLVKVACTSFRNRKEICLNEKNNIQGDFLDEIEPATLFFGNSNPGSLGLIMNRACCIEIGGYDEEQYPISDYYFFVKYLIKFGGVKVNKPFAFYRIEDNESLKIETLKGFVHNEYLFRNQALSLEFSSNYLTRLLLYPLAKLVTIQSAVHYKNHNSSFMPEETLNEVGIRYHRRLFQLYILFFRDAVAFFYLFFIMKLKNKGGYIRLIKKIKNRFSF